MPLPDFSLTGRTALITGASSGIGAHFAHTLAAAGAHVVLAARRTTALESHAAAIVAAGGSADVLALDVGDAAAVKAAVASVGRIDVAVNNAGVAVAKSAYDHSVEDWDHVLDINLRGAFLVATAVARGMRASGTGGAIVNVASILGFRQTNGVSAYAASKAGLVQLTKSLALEWARDNIRVNALCPGYIETDLNREFFAEEAGKAMIRRIPQRRLGKAEELDGALLLLASDAGRYITGAAIAVDGGHLVSAL